MVQGQSCTPYSTVVKLIVIDHVPAEVCPVCGDVLLRPETVRRIEVLPEKQNQPSSTVPLYEYA